MSEQSLPATGAPIPDYFRGPLKPHLAGKAPAAPLRWWMLALVGVLAFLVFANSLNNDFAFDDVAIVKDSLRVKNLDWIGIWTQNYWPKTEGVQPDALYRPITLWSYLANQAITPGFPWAFHLVNILLHALVTMLVSVLAWRLLGDRRVAVVVGILFAVHPLHVEAVANTVGRAEELAALWTLLALLVYLPARPLLEETAPPRRSYWHGILVAICFLIAILCKETPITFPAAVLVVDIWRWMHWPRLNRISLVRWMCRQTLRYYLPMTAMVGIYLALRIPACGLMSNTHVVHRVVNPLITATIPERIVTPFALLAKYLWLTVWPAHLSADYSAPSLPPTANPFAPLPLIGILTCLLAAIASVRFWRDRPAVLLLIGLFVTAYMLVANVLRIGTIFGERLFYSPSIFVLILAAWGMVALFEYLLERHRLIGAGAGLALLVAAIGGMSYRSFVRNTDWSDNVTLAIATGRDNLNSGKACCWAGGILILADRPNLVDTGEYLLERSIELTPDYVTPRWELAKYYGRKGELAKSVIYFAQAARLDPGTQLSHEAAQAILKDFRTTPPAQYMPILLAYQQEHPQEESGYFALALAYHAQGKFELAEASVRKALDTAGSRMADGSDLYHEAGAELAAIRMDEGNVGAAVSEYRTYANNLTNSAEAHCTFAEALMRLDPEKYHDAYLEADLNLKIANLIDPTNPWISTLEGKLAGLRAEAAARGPGRPEAGALTDVKPLHDDAVAVPGGARR